MIGVVGVTSEDGSERIEANPDVYLPEWLDGVATKATPHGLFVLAVSGRCNCGNRRYYIAPDWKVPAEWGGGYMTGSCSGCLGTMELSDEWLPVEQAVDSYADLQPPDETAALEDTGDDDPDAVDEPFRYLAEAFRALDLDGELRHREGSE